MHNIELDFIPVLILGSTALAFLYHAILFFFNRDRLLIHYLVYLFFTGVFLYSKTGLFAAAFGQDAENFLIRFFREAIQIIYLASYFNFIISAIGVSKKRKFFLFRYWPVIMTLLIVYAVIHPIAKFMLPNADFATAFVVMRVFIFCVTAIMLYQSYKLREIKFQLIILWGCTIYFIFGLVSFVTNLLPNDEWLAIYPLEWLMIGSFIDIMFFSIAIAHRNHEQSKILNATLLDEANKHIALQSVVMEKQRELENERSRIAADMHDDLGSGLTKITYLSQMALKGSDTENSLEKIKSTASELVANMSELIWVMKEENNTLEDLLTYIKSYAVEYLEQNNIALKITMPDLVPEITISGNRRRNIFLTVKECLHNIVKHANASHVVIEIGVNPDFNLTIHDNGIGFQSGSSRGNGLKNMKSRIENIGGKFLTSNEMGAKVCIDIPFSE